jgi:predicted glycosyltransferase
MTLFLHELRERSLSSLQEDYIVSRFNHSESAYIKQDMKSLFQVLTEHNSKSLVVRTECLEACGKVFRTVRVPISPTIRVT